MVLLSFFIFVETAFVKGILLAFENIGKGTVMIGIETLVDIFISQSFQQAVCSAETLADDLFTQTDRIEEFGISVGRDGRDTHLRHDL